MPDIPPLAPPPPAADALNPPPRRRPGRPKGAKSRHVIERENAIKAALDMAAIGPVETPQELLEAIMKSPACAVQDRQKAATVLLAYAVPKPAAQPPPRHPANLAADMDAAWRRAGRIPPPDDAAGAEEAQQPDAASPSGPLSHLTEEQRQALAEMLR